MAKKKTQADDLELGDGEEKKEKKPKKDLASLYVSANSILNTKSVVIPVSPAIDVMLGGGIPEGSFVIPTGKPKCGKTTSSLQFAANALKPEYACDLNPAGRTLYFFNIEGRLKRRDLLGIHGLNIDKIQIIQSKPGEILYAEDYIDIGERLINEKPGDIFIFDSFSQLCTKGERDADIGDRYRADAPLLLAKFCRRICNVVPINKSIVIGITHQIANQGGGGPFAPKSVEASGNKIQYQVDVRLHAMYEKDWKVGDVSIGQDVYWRCDSSAIGPPNIECISKLRYGYGLDSEAELVQLATDAGIIEKPAKSSWYSLPDGRKVQGADAIRQILVDEPNLYEKIYSEFKQMFNLE